MLTEKLKDLHLYTGTDQWYRHPLNQKILFTDGARYVAEEAGAFWLLDEIALAQQFQAVVAKEPFQLWQLNVVTSTATLTCEDGNGREVFRKVIEFTDFPEPGIALYCIDNVIMLRSEY